MNQAAAPNALIDHAEPLKGFKPSAYSGLMRGGFVDTPKMKFYCEVGGHPDHPAVILISGLGAQMLMWPTGFCEALIRHGFYVVRFDNRDTGLSTKIEHTDDFEPLTNWQRFSLMGRFKLGLSNRKLSVPYTLFDMSKDVRMIKDALGISEAHVIGCSMGGMIAQIYAATNPSRTLSLGLLSTSFNPPLSTPPMPKQMMSLMRPPAGTEEADLIGHTVEVLRQISSSHYFDEDKAREKATETIRRGIYPVGVQRQLMAIFATGSLNVTASSIKAKTLVVHGNHDKVFLTRHGRSLARAIEGAKYVEVNGMGHEIPHKLEPYLARLFANNAYAMPIDVNSFHDFEGDFTLPL